MELNKKTGCKKSKFSSETQAIAALKCIQFKSKRKVVPVRAYLCKFCGTWHLTSRLDSFKLQKENEELKLKVTDLEQEIVDLNKHWFKLLKEETNENKKQVQIEVNKNEKVKSQDKKISEQAKLISKYKVEINELYRKLNTKNEFT